LPRVPLVKPGTSKPLQDANGTALGVDAGSWILSGASLVKEPDRCEISPILAEKQMKIHMAEYLVFRKSQKYILIQDL